MHVCLSGFTIEVYGFTIEVYGFTIEVYGFMHSYVPFWHFTGCTEALQYIKELLSLLCSVDLYLVIYFTTSCYNSGLDV